MKAKLILFSLLALLAPLGATAQFAPLGAGAQVMETVLNKMDAAAASFRTTEADFVWDQYQLVVQETDTQKGSIYFRRSGNEIEMAADIREPDARAILFSDGKLKMYQPKIDQVTEYGTTAKNRGDIESFLVLGFGGRGHDLLKSFNLRYMGMETVDGTETWEIELVPKSAKMQGWFEKILLWIDTKRGVSVQQKFFQPGGDYKLARYLHIKIDGKLPDGAFKLKTTSKTRVVTAN